MLFGVEIFTLPSSGKICFHMVEAFTVIPFPTLGILGASSKATNLLPD